MSPGLLGQFVLTLFFEDRRDRVLKKWVCDRSYSHTRDVKERGFVLEACWPRAMIKLAGNRLFMLREGVLDAVAEARNLCDQRFKLVCLWLRSLQIPV